MTTYIEYASTVPFAGLLIIGTSVAGPATITGTSGAGNNPNLLGDVANDTFTFNGQTFTYVGLITLSVGGSTTQGLIGSLNGSTFVFVPGTTPLVEVAVGQTAASPTNPSSQWNLTTDAAQCLLAGTMVATPDGERAIELLQPGDLVLTADGTPMPVRWVGRSAMSRFCIEPLRVLPIRIRAGALGPNQPHRDLLVSPNHGVLIGGILAHAGTLVNGRSIVRETDMEPIFTYYHLELDTHALLLAEGAPVESFLETAVELTFQNWSERVAPSRSQELPYPRAKSARQLPRSVRDLLDIDLAEYSAAA